MQSTLMASIPKFNGLGNAVGSKEPAQSRPFSIQPSHVTREPHRRAVVKVLAAKKKKGSNNKQSSNISSTTKNRPPVYASAPVIMHNLLLIESYFRKTQRPLFSEEIDISKASQALWEAPFAVLAHDMSEPEPLFVYANAKALDLFETDWDHFTGGIPSTTSADPEREVQEERTALLNRVLEEGYCDDYQGWRRSFQGTRFKISKATVFNVDSPSGQRVGQAAVIREWEYEDGRKGGENGDVIPIAEGVFEDTITEAQAAVEEQAALVRRLKEEDGLSNGDQQVQDAVKILLERKQVVESLLQKRGSEDQSGQ